jgi:hypothetical protein
MLRLVRGVAETTAQTTDLTQEALRKSWVLGGDNQKMKPTSANRQIAELLAEHLAISSAERATFLSRP